MISLIILTILLAYTLFKSLYYLRKSFSPLALSFALLSGKLLFLVYETRYEFIGIFDLESRIPLLASTDFYWFTSILLILCVIVLRDLHRNLYFEKLTTDLVRKLAHEDAKKQ